METKQLEKFCPWARRELIDAVKRRCVLFALDDNSRSEAGPDADVVNGTVLTQAQRAQRSSLYSRIESMGYGAFCEAEAYGWFNRFAAIRYMELHGFLPSRMRMLSGVDGSFDPQCLRAVGELDLPGLDVPATLQLIVQNQADEAYRDILVAQCNELAECLPEVFGRVGGSDALTLPDGLLLRGEHDFLYHLVTDIPESDWQNVEVLGWMYQFYNAERKVEVDAAVKKGAKVEERDLAPKTQLFTPEWIVRYMVDNSLGRLWILNHPESSLRQHMDYFIDLDDENEGFVRVTSPEEITLCDPACGSGHILSYAFGLLFCIYQECGYAEREIPSLILSKNLSGYEVDERAAQIASLVLALRGREHDRRFFRREVRADVRVLESIPLAEGECGLDQVLVDELNHLGEIGSLLDPTNGDMAALRDGLASCAGDLLSAKTAEKLGRAVENCEALRRRFTVVVANPPYLGSSAFGPFMAKWIKTNYPDVKSDLCTCFIERILRMSLPSAFSGLATSNSWMFLSSFEKLRNELIDDATIESLVQLSVHGFHGIAAQVCTFILRNSVTCGFKGGYIRLNDFDHHSLQEPKTLEAIKNPACGYFYRADASTFHTIPGSPIAYWARESQLCAFDLGRSLGTCGRTSKGLITGDNDYSLRMWWECPYTLFGSDISSIEEANNSAKKWFPCNKGGIFRKWYGNHDYSICWIDDGRNVFEHAKETGHHAQDYDSSLKFKPNISWSDISSGLPSFRFRNKELSDHKGMPFYPSEFSITYFLGLLNSSVARLLLTYLSPTLSLNIGELEKIPVVDPDKRDENEVDECVNACISIANNDWDSLETSWDFKRSPLL